MLSHVFDVVLTCVGHLWKVSLMPLAINVINYCHERAVVGHELFFDAPLGPRIKMKIDGAMLSIVFVLFNATVLQTGVGQLPKARPAVEHEKHVVRIVAPEFGFKVSEFVL